MSIKYTRQGCKVETTFRLLPDGSYSETVELSVAAPKESFSIESDAAAHQRVKEAPRTRPWYR